MKPYDDIHEMIRKLDRILAPFRNLEHLYGVGFQNVVEDLQRKQDLLRSALPELSSSYLNAMEYAQTTFERFREFEQHSPAMSLLSEAHNSLSSVISEYANLSSISRASSNLGYHWQDSVSPYQKLIDHASAAELALKDHFTRIAESALLAQERLLSVPWNSIGSATSMNARYFMPISDHFTTLVYRYKSLIDSFKERENFMASFPPIISHGPPIEILTSAKVLGSLSLALPDDGYSEVDLQIESKITNEFESSFDKLLEKLNPQLNTLWLGAKESLRSENPDRPRHILFSLRELVDHVLRTLAPNEQIKKWTDDPSHFHEGRPTRKARILYVCRNINHGPFTDFINADVKTSIEFIALFQRGHELEVSFSEKQLSTLVTRTGSFLRFLLLTSQTTK